MNYHLKMTYYCRNMRRIVHNKTIINILLISAILISCHVDGHQNSVINLQQLSFCSRAKSHGSTIAVSFNWFVQLNDGAWMGTQTEVSEI
jgi:hypothetical protein